MTSSIGRLVLLSSLLLFTQASCASEYIVYHFELPVCPRSAFSLPDSVIHQSFKFKAVQEERGSMCPGARAYRDEQLDLEARFNRGQTCSLDVGYLLFGSSGEKLNEELERKVTTLLSSSRRAQASRQSCQLRRSNDSPGAIRSTRGADRVGLIL